MSGDTLQGIAPYAVCMLALDHNILGPIQFENGVEAGPKDNHLRSPLQEMACVLRPDQKWDILSKSTWLRVPVSTADALHSMQQKVLDTAIALHIADPIDCKYFIVLTHVYADSNNLVLDKGSLEAPIWTTQYRYDQLNKPDCQLIVDSVSNAFVNKSRIVNPIRLLELGLRSDHPYLRTMLWATALDGLLMAVKSQIFEDRLCRYLGEDYQVLPSLTHIGGMSLGLREVARELFELRSKVAHGLKIPSKFWHRSSPFEDDAGSTSSLEPTTLAEYLHAASHALLIAVLRKIVQEDLPTVDNAKMWKTKLDR